MITFLPVEDCRGSDHSMGYHHWDQELLARYCQSGKCSHSLHTVSRPSSRAVGLGVKDVILLLHLKLKFVRPPTQVSTCCDR